MLSTSACPLPAADRSGHERAVADFSGEPGAGKAACEDEAYELFDYDQSLPLRRPLMAMCHSGKNDKHFNWGLIWMSLLEAGASQRHRWGLHIVAYHPSRRASEKRICRRRLQRPTTHRG
jgi:hypothetical protein